MELADIFNLFSKNNIVSQEQNNSIPKEILEQYPYGQFPLNNSKEMQNEHLKNVLHNERKNNVSAFNIPAQNIAKNNYSNFINTQQNNNIINNLQPLISLISNSDKKKNNNDLLNILLPFFIGKNNQLSEIFNMLSKKQTKKDEETKNEENINCNEEITNFEYKAIDSYEKI